MDIGFAYNKVGIKDIYVKRQLGLNNWVQAGYFVHHFGLQSATSTSFKISMEEPLCESAFDSDRLLGLMYAHSKGRFLGTFSFFSETEAMKLTSEKLGNQDVGAMTRLVYRPLHETGKILQVGMSAAVMSPQYSSTDSLNHRQYTLAANFPTRISKLKAVSSTINEAQTLYKFTPELLAAYG